MAIKIIKNTLIDPMHKTCEECGSEFTFNYVDIQRGTRMSIWSEVTYRYVVCPVCKHECSFEVVKIKDNQPWETEQCDLSKKED